MSCHLSYEGSLVSHKCQETVSFTVHIGLLNIFTQPKDKEVCLTEWTLQFEKFILLSQQCYCEVCIVIVIN